MNRARLVTVPLAAITIAAGSLAQAAPAQAASVGAVNKVVAIGDSYPSGYAGNEKNGYPERYARGSGHSMTINRAVAGWTAQDVVTMFANDPASRRNVRDVKTVIVTVGSNDVLYAVPDPTSAANNSAAYSSAVATMKSRLHSLLGTISYMRQHNNSRVIVTTYNTIYQDGSAGASHGATWVKGADRVTKAVNAAIMSECRTYGMTCVDIYPSFDVANVDSLVTPDGSHPSSAGHQVYADRIYAAKR